MVGALPDSSGKLWCLDQDRETRGLGSAVAIFEHLTVNKSLKEENVDMVVSPQWSGGKDGPRQ